LPVSRLAAGAQDPETDAEPEGLLGKGGGVSPTPRSRPLTRGVRQGAAFGLAKAAIRNRRVDWKGGRRSAHPYLLTRQIKDGLPPLKQTATG